MSLDPSRAAPLPRGTALIVVAFVAVLALTVGPLLAGGSPPQGFVSLAAALAIFAALLLGIVRHRPAGFGWRAIAAGIAANAVGTLGSGDAAVFGLGGLETISPLAIALGHGLILIGLVGLLPRQSRGKEYLLDAAVATSAGGLVLWLLAIQPIIQHAAGVDPTMLAVAVLDVVLLGALSLGLLVPGRTTSAFWFIVVAVLTTLAGDAVGLFAKANDLVVPPQLLGAVAWLGSAGWAAAALQPTMARPVQPDDANDAGPAGFRLVVLSIASSAGPLLLAVQWTIDAAHVDVPSIAVGSGVLAMLVAVRLGRLVQRLQHSMAEGGRLRSELLYRATHDALTSLPNRSKFGEQLDVALQRAGSGVGVYFCDLDDFKAVNDTLGHAAGDELLSAVAARFRHHLRPADFVARLGGDEFGVLVRDVSAGEQAEEVAKRLSASLDQPFSIGGQTVYAHASIGVATGVAGEVDAAELVRNADVAMYLAKGEGKGRYQVFEPSMHAAIVGRLALRSELEAAIAGGQLIVDYQPLVRIADGSVEGVEALVRWDHPTRGVLPPSEFIPLAEATGLIVPLGRSVLLQAAQAARDWERSVGVSLKVSVNIAAPQLSDDRFVSDVRDALQRSGLPPERLVLEVTEGVMRDTETAVRVLAELRAIGVQIAIDDFGTGYSSLSRITSLPIDILKIDRSFIDALAGDSRERGLTSTVVALARSLGVDVVAEGIERPEQLDELRRLGCRLGQGYLLARPMAASAIERFIVVPAPGRRVPQRLRIRRAPGAAMGQ
ncbi:MAG: EAL domain-containing protein [Chloroflexi bacterium]|nr:EAL domain-containing protein [Chloroflexota bacterium]